MININKARAYPWIGALIGVAIGFVAVLMLKKREGFLFNETLLNLVITCATVGAGIGAAADILGKGDAFTNHFGGIIGAAIYGAGIGAVIDPKFGQPLPRAIAGAVVGAIAVVLYSKLIVQYFTNKNGKFNAVTYVIFGIVIGAIYGASIVIVDVFYNAIFFDSVIRGNGVSISSYMINTIYTGAGIGVIVGGIFGAFFGAFFGVIHSAIGGRGAVGGAIAGAFVIGEVFQSFSGMISGLFAGAILGAILSKSRMGSMVAGATVGAGVGALLSAVVSFAISPYISYIFIIPAFLISGYRAGMVFRTNRT